MVQVGQQVPDMELAAFHRNDIQKLRFSDYRGRWLVLLFYPADFTFVCPTELEEAANYYGEYQKLGAEVMSVSTDTAYAHKAWHDQSPAIRKIQYPMLADPTGKLCKAFGTYLEEEGLSLRGSFIIDPDGVLRVAEIHDLSIGRSSEELVRKLQAAVFVRENKGEVCPASWQPGRKSLRPAVDLIGKI